MPPATHRSRLGIAALLHLLVSVCLAVGGLRAQPAADPPLTVTGTLVDERGTPAAGVEVVLRPYPSRYELDLAFLGHPEALPEPADHSVSRSDGTFSLSADAIGPYRLEIRPSPPATGLPVAVPPVYRDILPLRVPLHLEPIALPERHALTVRALNLDGQPVEGALVFVDPAAAQREDPPWVDPYAQPELLHPELGRASARTDSEGVARFLTPGERTRVAVSAAGLALETRTAAGGRAVFRLERAPGVALRVLGSDGRPAQRAAIRLAGQRPVPLAVANEHGMATIGVAAGARTAFAVETARGAFARAAFPNRRAQEGAPETEIVEVRLDPPTTIAGQVADAETGFTVPGAVVWRRSDPGIDTVTDGSGGFDLTAPRHRPGSEIGIVASGYMAATAKVAAERSGNSRSLSIGLVPAAPLAGWIVDAFDRPVAGANVQLAPSGRGLFFQLDEGRVGRTTSGPDGSFWIANAFYGSAYRLTVKAPAFASAQRDLPALPRGAPVEPLRIVLTQGRQPWGTIVDLDGTPLAGAQIRLLWPPDDPQVREDYGHQDATAPASSNDRGEFEFARVAPGRYGLDVSHPDYIDLLDNTAIVPHGDGYVDLGVFALTPGAEIHGVVVGPDGRPVEGAEVSSRQRTRHLMGHSRTATTDRDGRFRLGGMLPALADVIAAADGYIATFLESVRPGTGEAIAIELTKGAALAGRVFEADGSPAAGVPVGLELASGQLRLNALGRSPQELFRRDRSDDDGRFRFDNVFPARWAAEARNETGRATLRQIELGEGESREIELRLEPPDILTVVVTNDLDQPVANASVRAEPDDETEDTVFGDTDAGGRAELWVARGPATVEVDHPDLLEVSRAAVVGPGANELHVQLHPGGEISGVVRSADGAPVAGAAVEAGPELAGQDGETDRAISLRRMRRFLEPPIRTVSDLGGRFRVAGLDRGSYRVVARLGGYTEGQVSEPIEIRGQSVAGIEIVLEPGASIRGVAIGLDSASLASTEVQAWKDALFRTVSPAVDGAFELSGLAPGTWQISATTGERRTPVQEVLLEPGLSGAAVELRFEPGLRLSGQVLIAGQPAGGAYVGAAPQSQERPRRTRTDHQGRFAIEGLQPDAYELRIRHDLGTADHSVDLRSDHDGMLVNLQPRPAAPD